MNVLALIPARGGSQGVPRKNIKPLLGMSLIERAFETARASGVADQIILSTDDEEIADHGRSIGVPVPFLRPPSLATADTPMVEVALHAIHQMEQLDQSFDCVLLIQPTSPLRRPEHLIRATELLMDHDSVCSVVELPRTHSPDYVMKIDEKGLLVPFLDREHRVTRRQDARTAFTRDGTVYLTKRTVLEQHGNFYGDDCRPMILQASESLSIDTEADWIEAERRIQGVLV